MKIFIGWGLGLLVAFLGFLMMIGGGLLAGLILVIIGMSLIPNVRYLLLQKTNIVAGKDARKLIYGVLWAAFLGAIIYSSANQGHELRTAEVKEREIAAKQVKAEKEAKLAKAEKERGERTAYFSSNKESIIEKIESLKSQKKYSKAIEKINLYIQTGDKDLISLKDDIANIQKKIEVETRTGKILTNLKTIPVKNIDKNYKLYQELVSMHPDNSRYKKKVEYYKEKVAERDIKIAAEKVFYGEKPIQSSWDGSYYEVERYLKRVAHDPDSIDIEGCSKPYKAEEGWIVLCKYRGKNAFGGKILKHNWFVIRQKQVIEVEEPSAYSTK